MNRESRNITVAALLVAGLAAPGPGTRTPSAPAPPPVFLAQADTTREAGETVERTRDDEAAASTADSP